MPVPHAPKPEPIRLNMDGIAPEPVTFGGTEQNFQYDWQKLSIDAFAFSAANI